VPPPARPLARDGRAGRGGGGGGRRRGRRRRAGGRNSGGCGAAGDTRRSCEAAAAAVAARRRPSPWRGHHQSASWRCCGGNRRWPRGSCYPTRPAARVDAGCESVRWGWGGERGGRALTTLRWRSTARAALLGGVCPPHDGIVGRVLCRAGYKAPLQHLRAGHGRRTASSAAAAAPFLCLGRCRPARGPPLRRARVGRAGVSLRVHPPPESRQTGRRRWRPDRRCLSALVHPPRASRGRVCRGGYPMATERVGEALPREAGDAATDDGGGSAVAGGCGQLSGTHALLELLFRTCTASVVL